MGAGDPARSKLEFIYHYHGVLGDVGRGFTWWTGGLLGHTLCGCVTASGIVE